MLLVPAFKKPLHYRLCDQGVFMSQEEVSQNFEWDKITKAISTSRSIILYTDKNIATILPREDMGDMTTEAVRIISSHVDPKKVRIRY